MELIISIKDEDAKTILDQVQAAYGWNGLTPDEIAAKLCDEIKHDIASKAVNGQEILDRAAKAAVVRTVTERSLNVALK